MLCRHRGLWLLNFARRALLARGVLSPACFLAPGYHRLRLYFFNFRPGRRDRPVPAALWFWRACERLARAICRHLQLRRNALSHPVEQIVCLDHCRSVHACLVLSFQPSSPPFSVLYRYANQTNTCHLSERLARLETGKTLHCSHRCNESAASDHTSIHLKVVTTYFFL